MSISTGQVITWADLATTCYNAIVSCCCNIGNVNNVPLRLRAGNGYLAVASKTYGIADSNSTATSTWYGNGTNLISAVAASTIKNDQKTGEWDVFLSDAKIDSRSNKKITAKELGLAIGLYQQFLAFHVKPIYSRRQVYNTVESQALFQSMKYVTGTCTPKYQLTAIEPTDEPTTTDADITEVLNQSIYWPSNNWGMLDSTNNPVLSRSYLS